MKAYPNPEPYHCGAESTRKMQAMSCNRTTAQRCGRLIRHHFRDYAELQFITGCSPRTARYWWNGETAPGCLPFAIIAAHVGPMKALTAILEGK